MNRQFRVLQMDNFDRESYNYPERWVTEAFPQKVAIAVADLLNSFERSDSDWYYCARPTDYKPDDFSPV